jgi:hypothetical protein
VFRRPFRLLLLLALFGAALAGCGGGSSTTASSSSTASSSAAPAGGAQPTQAEPSPAKKAEPSKAEPSPLDPLAELLEEARFQGATPVPGGANHIASALSVQPAQGGNLINVYYYDNPKFARQEDERIEGFFASHPRHGQVQVHGHYLVSTVAESELTPVEKKNFRIVVKEAAVAEAAE